MNVPIRDFCRRLFATLQWLIAAACLLIAAFTAEAAEECSLLPPPGVSLEEVDTTVPLTGRNPLILIHGINRHGAPAPPDCHLWEPFIDYYNVQTALNHAYKLYEFSYNSNSVHTQQLGVALKNKIDAANFGNKPISFVAHSMGGLIAREFMRLDAGGDPLSGPREGDNVFRLITLGTPHHGLPLANGLSRGIPSSGLWGLYFADLDRREFPVPVNEPNRFDLHWDNLIRPPYLDYETFPQQSERNNRLELINNEEQYEDRIIAYAGKTDAQTETDPDYKSGALANETFFLVDSDGAVPTDSALFKGKNILKAEPLDGYNHSQIAQGKCPPRTDCPGNLFGKIRDDLLAPAVGPYANLVPQGIALSSTNLSPGANLTVTWQLANTGDAAANASTTVVRINRSPDFAGPINNLAQIPTAALAAHTSQQQTRTIPVPQTAGTYYVWVIADNLSEVTNQGPNVRDDKQHSLPFTVTAPTVPLTVAGIAASYPATEAPFRKTINLTGSGFSSINQITWACTMPNGTSCGAIPPWTPANWNGKFSPASDTVATISPVLLVPGDPAGAYTWSVTFSNSTTSITKNFTVSFNPQGSYATKSALGVSPNPGTVGQPVSFAASVISGGGVPTGTITFREGSTVLDSRALSNGVATFSTSSLAVGTHTITADYSGGGNFLPSTSNSVGAVVQPPTPQFAVAPSSGTTSGQQGGPFSSIQFQVSASGGTINYSVDQNPYWLDVLPQSGVAGPTPIPVVFTVNANGRSLPPGVYTGEVFFAINGGGVGSIFRNVMLTVSAQTGALEVSGGDMFSTGPQFGPFAPDSFNYQLSASRGSVGFSISGWPSWLTPLTTSGTLTTSPTTVTFLVNSNAQTLAPGTYGPSIVTFTNTTNGQGNTTRTATLTITPLPTLQVSPSTGIVASGNVGGPFSPSSFEYQISSTTGSLDFSISGIPSWLTPSQTSGTLTTSPTAITFTVNSNANNLIAGSYNATIVFFNNTNGKGNQVRLATLRANVTGMGPSFQGLGDLGRGYSLAAGVSSDGKVVVGQSYDTNGFLQAFRWANGTMTALGLLPGSNQAEANAANSDGSTVVGEALMGGEIHQAFRWINGSMSSLGFLPSDTSSYAWGVNSNGSIVVGSSRGAGVQAFRSVNGAMSGLGFLPGYNFSLARAVNADGTVIVGYACNPAPCPGGQAFRWVNGSGMTGLGFLPGGNGSAAFGENSDGTVVVGYSQDGTTGNQRAFRWTAATGMADLGISPTNNSSADAVNADGSVVVGYSNTTGNGAFRWTAADGAKSIEDLLTASGVDFTGWTLNRATGVSADGTVIIGNGGNTFGVAGDWIAHLPLPSPTLQVSPAIGYSATGSQGGPFLPPTFNYQLAASSGTLGYTITNLPSWLTASPASGTVGTTGTTITLTVNSSANSLAPGSYSPAPVVFTNTTNGQGNTTRVVSLTVNPPPAGILQVTPGTGVSASGTQSGPFSPLSFTYRLSSTSGSVNYSISGLPPWLTASSTSGTVTPAGTNITFTINASANSLSPGPYDTSITFTNATNGLGSQARAATLTVVAPPPPPTLQVSPTTNIAAWGKRGGPFAPASFSYQIMASRDSVRYSISGVPNWLSASAPLLGTVTTVPTTVTFTLNSAAALLAPGAYSPSPINFTNTTNGQGNTSRTVMLSVAPPLFQGTATLLSASGACSVVSGLSAGGLLDSAYRPRMNPSEPESGLIFKFAGSTTSLFRASGNDQMRGAGTYAGNWISDRATSTSNQVATGVYNLTIAPALLNWATQFVQVDGTITNFTNTPGCNIVFRGAYERAPD